MYQQLIDEFGISGVTWESLLSDYVDEFYKSCIPFPHLVCTLENLQSHSIHLGMITNGKGQFQMDNIKALGIERYFDTILISEWEGMKKPHPEIFRKALRNLSVTAEESIFVGDHPENDVIGAKNIGMVGVWKKDPQWSNVPADFTIDNLPELPLIVQELNRERIKLSGGN